MKLPQHQLIIALTFTLGLVGFTSCLTRLWAQPVTPVGTRTTTAQAFPSKLLLEYQPPTDGRVPSDGQRDAGRRPNRRGCPLVDKPLTALAPAYYVGLTTSEHPTFWVYVPYSPKLPYKVKFVLWDEQQTVKLYESSPSQLTDGPGIVSFSIPNSATPLEIGKTYRWSFSVTCNNGVGLASVRRWVKRVVLPPALTSQLQAVTPRERIALYAAKGLWHDALTELALLRRQNPQDQTLTADWDELLRNWHVGLDDIASEPIVQCCTQK